MQISLFDGKNKFKIDKPIRLIELFAGYGSQHFALEYLGVQFESWKICEWAVKSIQAYKDAHFGNDNIDYSKELNKEELFDYLAKKGISSNYNESMTFEQIKRLGEEKARKIYNNICATHNLVNIQQAKGKDLDIVNTDKYCYIMTYSFPCQDLSSAGLGKGMEKGSGTRSGMLWEVERILDELKQENRELPQVLVMENVPEVIGTNNIKHFAKWLEKLEELGYKNKWQVLNAKDYGVPQNRERCFMVGILGDYYYDFPKSKKLDLRLKDLLEDEVDEKYYISDKIISYLNKKVEQGWKKDFKTDINGVSSCICNPARNQVNDNWIEDGNMKRQLCNTLLKENKVKDYDIIRHSYTNSRMNDNRIQNSQYHDCSATLDTRCDCLGVVVPKLIGGIGEMKSNGGTQYYQQDRVYDANAIAMCQPASLPSGSYMYQVEKRIRKLTPKECFRLMGVKDQDFERIAQNQSNASLYHLAGDSIVVDVLMAIFKEML